jgi:diguanylate cyclase (GGDEF)-like protein
MVFTADVNDLADLEEILSGLADQASIALDRIDLAARVHESEREQDVLAYRASHDGLTGLANAELFRDELRMARRSAGNHLTAVLFIDLDDFKVINDTLGHEVGDAVLVISAQRIRACLRREDLGARLGGDEFAVLLHGLSDAAPAETVARRITAALAEPARIGGIPIDCRASVGLATACTPEEYDVLLRQADTALYAAKAAGKGSWRPYDPAMRSPLRRTGDLRAELEKVLRPRPAEPHPDARGLQMHYQPIVELATGALRGFEALIRWDHPNYGTIPVSDIITVAEQTGLIIPLGDWIMERAMAEAVAFTGSAERPGPYVSVNVAAIQLTQPDFAQRVAAGLHATALDPGRFVVEITESQLVRDDEPIWSELAKLRDLGVRVAIDDYGTGYASLSYLRHPVIDVAKLDRSFLLGVDGTGTESDRARILLRAVVGVTRELGIDLIAEGIEHENVRSELIDLGFRYGQGHLFASAMPIEKAVEWSTVSRSVP